MRIDMATGWVGTRACRARIWATARSGPVPPVRPDRPRVARRAHACAGPDESLATSLVARAGRVQREVVWPSRDYHLAEGRPVTPLSQIVPLVGPSRKGLPSRPADEPDGARMQATIELAEAGVYFLTARATLDCALAPPRDTRLPQPQRLPASQSRPPGQPGLGSGPRRNRKAVASTAGELLP